MNPPTNTELTFAAKSLIAYIVIPLLIVTPVSLYLTYSGLKHTLDLVGKDYVNRIEHVITEIKTDITLAIDNLNSCETIGQKLLFASNLRELIIIKDNIAVCSSKRGEVHYDITPALDGHAIPSGTFLWDVEGNQDQRTIIVAHAMNDAGRDGIVAVVEKNYLLDRILHISDNKINAITVKFNKRVYPSSRKFESHYIHRVLKSTKYGFSLLIEANRSYVTKATLFALAISLPLSLIISAVLYLVMRQLKQGQDLATDLKRGLKRKELFLVYQPLVDSHTHQLRGMEALIRWQHPSIGLVRPDLFIPLAERQLLINNITDFVLKQAYDDLSQTNATFQYSLGVNVPPSYLYSQQHLNALVEYAKKFKSIGIELIVEITERQILDQAGREALVQLRQHAVKISIDDFGTGHTALSVIQQTQFDFLKIDKCFVDTIGVETVNSAVLNTIIELGHRLNVQIVAEGVEHEHQAQYLAQMGVHKLQGYYFAKPINVDEIQSDWL